MAIAVGYSEREAGRNPTGKVFIHTYNLGAASSVQTGIKALLEKELIFEINGAYFVYDRFLSKWLLTR